METFILILPASQSAVNILNLKLNATISSIIKGCTYCSSELGIILSYTYTANPVSLPTGHTAPQYFTVPYYLL